MQTTNDLNSAKHSFNVTPTRPTNLRPSGTDYTNYYVNVTQCRSNVCIVNLVRDGKPSYKADLTKAILDAKSVTEELGVLTVSNLKKEKTEDSKFVVVKKTSSSTITDKVMVAFSEADTEAVTKLARAVAKCQERYTKPYKDSKQKIVAAFGKIDDQSDSGFLDEYISSDDVAKVVVALY